jgi:hypothetical protein
MGSLERGLRWPFEVARILAILMALMVVAAGVTDGWDAELLPALGAGIGVSLFALLLYWVRRLLRKRLRNG